MGTRKPKASRVADSSILCPFFKYLSHKYTQLTCESLQDNINMTLGFDNSDSFNNYMHRCCAGEPKLCRYYRLLMEEKYQGVEELNFNNIKAELYQKLTRKCKGETP